MIYRKYLSELSVVLLLSIIFLLSACNDEKPLPFVETKTSDIWIGVELSANGPDTFVTVQLGLEDTGVQPFLTGENYFEVSSFAETIRLQVDDEFGYAFHDGILQGNTEEQPINVTFYRQNGEVISGTIGTLPAPIVISQPEQRAIVSYSDTVSVVWDANPDGGEIELLVQYICTNKAGDLDGGELALSTIEDNGFFEFKFTDDPSFEEARNALFDPSEPCEVYLFLERYGQGSVDMAFFDTSYVNAYSVMTVDLSLNL